MFGLPLEAVARVLFYLAVIVLLMASAVYVMRRLRATDNEGPASSGELLTQFRDLHSQGQLSDEEYQTIKGRLSAEMQREIKREEDAD